MGKETLEIQDIQDNIGNGDEPLFGRSKKNTSWYPPNTQIRYFVGCITDDGLRMELERIMTKSLSGNAGLKNPGDIFVISETGSFDKDGCYQTVVKYLYVPE